MARVVVATAHHHILRHVAAALHAHGHQVVGALTAGSLPVMTQVVEQLGCPRFDLPLLPGELNIGRGMQNHPEYADQIRAAASGLHALEADFLLGWAINVLPPFLLEAARHPINVHPSDLPRYRGGFPLEAQILAGERKFSISIHHTVARIDAGAVLAQSQPLKIKRTDTMTGLLDRSMPIGAGLAAQVVSQWAELSPVPQAASKGPTPHAWGIRRRKNAQGQMKNTGILGRLRVEWDLDSALDINRAARAFDMMGGVVTSHGKNLFRISRAQVLDRTVTGTPGDVLAMAGDTLEVQAHDAKIRVTGAFLKEGAIAIGERFCSTALLSRFLPFEGAER